MHLYLYFYYLFCFLLIFTRYLPIIFPTIVNTFTNAYRMLYFNFFIMDFNSISSNSVASIICSNEYPFLCIFKTTFSISLCLPGNSGFSSLGNSGFFNALTQITHNTHFLLKTFFHWNMIFLFHNFHFLLL